MDDILFKATDSPKMADGVYDAVLTEVIRVTSDKDGDTRDYARWLFTIYSADYPDGTFVSANSSLNFGRRAKARSWFESAIGREIRPGEVIKPSEYLPHCCQLVMKNDKESGYLRVEDLWKARPEFVAEYTADDMPA